MTSPAPRSQAWLLLVIFFALASFSEVVALGHFSAFTPLFLHDIGLGAESITRWTGPLTSAAFLLGIPLVPLWGILADRFGRKPLILRSFYIEAAAMALAAVSQNVWLYLIARAIVGLALGNTGLMLASISDSAPRQRVGLALAVVNGSLPIGAFIGSLAGGFAVDALGVRTLFWIDAGMLTFVVLGLTLVYRDAYVRPEVLRFKQQAAQALRAVFASPLVRSIFAVAFLATSGTFAVYAYLPIFIDELYAGADLGRAIGLVYGLGGVATLIASPLWGALADRAGHRRVLAMVLALTTLLWPLPMFAQSVPQLTLVWVLVAVTSTAISSTGFAIISLNIDPRQRGAVMAMAYVPSNFGFIVGPLAASFIAPYTLRALFPLAAGFVGLALAVYLATRGATVSRADDGLAHTGA